MSRQIKSLNISFSRLSGPIFFIIGLFNLLFPDYMVFGGTIEYFLFLLGMGGLGLLFIAIDNIQLARAYNIFMFLTNVAIAILMLIGFGQIHLYFKITGMGIAFHFLFGVLFGIVAFNKRFFRSKSK